MDDRERFARYYLTNEDLFRGRAIKLMAGNRADAEDLLQSTMFKAWRFFDKFQEGTKFNAWVLNMMRRVWISNWHKRSAMETEDYIENDPGLPYHKQKAEEKILVNELVELISDRQYDLLRLVEVEGYEYREVAEKLGMPIGTVLQSVWRAKQSMRKQAEWERPNPIAA